MKRYIGSELGASPRIAVVANDAIGNFVVGTPLVQALKEKHSGAEIVYFGGTRTRELSEASDLFDKVVHLHGTDPALSASVILDLKKGRPFDLVFNMEWGILASSMSSILCSEETLVCGPCLDIEGRGMLAFQPDIRGELWNDQEWISEKLTQKYDFLDTGFIGELFCRLAYFEGEVPKYKLPSASCPFDLPDILISTAVSLKEKLWEPGLWRQILTELKAEGKTVALLGAPPKDQKKYWKGDSLEDDLVSENLVMDWRGKLSMPQVVGALQRVKGVLTVDNGILHLAASGDAQIVGLFRNGIHRLWAPPITNLQVLVPKVNQLVNEIELQKVRQALDKVGLY